MGDALYEQLDKDHPGVACRTYAPVGSHRDLLAYLVRRLLENGANSSFVAQAADDNVPVSALLQRPADAIGRPQQAAHPRVPLPADLFGTERRNSRGVEFGDRAALAQLITDVEVEATADLTPVADATTDQADAAVTAARSGFVAWSRAPAAVRAAALERAAQLLEDRRARFIALLQREGGKTLDDALSEVREAIDFCRYYAAQGRKLFGAETAMPGPTGESNALEGTRTTKSQIRRPIHEDPEEHD